MDLPCHQLFAGATLPADQYGRRGGSHLPDEREDLLHRRRRSYQVPEYAAKAQLALKLVGFLEVSLVADRAFQKSLEGARFHRLLQKPERVEIMDGRKRLFQAAEARQRDCRSEVAALLQVPQQFKAVHARHYQIRNDDIRVKGREPYQRFLAVGCDLRNKVTIGKHGGHGSTLAALLLLALMLLRLAVFFGLLVWLCVCRDNRPEQQKQGSGTGRSNELHSNGLRHDHYRLMHEDDRSAIRKPGAECRKMPRCGVEDDTSGCRSCLLDARLAEGGGRMGRLALLGSPAPKRRQTC